MPAPKAPEAAPKAVPPSPKAENGRKPWKKRSTAEVILEQVDKLRKEVAAEEAALNAKKAELKTFEDMVKALNKQ